MEERNDAKQTKKRNAALFFKPNAQEKSLETTASRNSLDENENWKEANDFGRHNKTWNIS